MDIANMQMFITLKKHDCVDEMNETQYLDEIDHTNAIKHNNEGYHEIKFMDVSGYVGDIQPYG